MFVTCLFTISAGEDANSRMKTHFINKITFYNHGTISSKYDQSMPPAVNVNNLVLVIYCWHIWQEILILVVNEMQRYYKPHSFILTGHIIDHMKNIMNRFIICHFPKIEWIVFWNSLILIKNSGFESLMSQQKYISYFFTSTTM